MTLHLTSLGFCLSPSSAAHAPTIKTASLIIRQRHGIPIISDWLIYTLPARLPVTTPIPDAFLRRPISLSPPCPLSIQSTSTPLVLKSALASLISSISSAYASGVSRKVSMPQPRRTSSQAPNETRNQKGSWRPSQSHAMVSPWVGLCVVAQGGGEGGGGYIPRGQCLVGWRPGGGSARGRGRGRAVARARASVGG